MLKSTHDYCGYLKTLQELWNIEYFSLVNKLNMSADLFSTTSELSSGCLKGGSGAKFKKVFCRSLCSPHLHGMSVTKFWEPILSSTFTDSFLTKCYIRSRYSCFIFNTEGEKSDLVLIYAS